MYVVFHDYPGLEFGLPKSHDFPGQVVTLNNNNKVTVTKAVIKIFNLAAALVKTYEACQDIIN